MPEDQIAKSLEDLTKKVDDVQTKVNALEKKWQWITSAAFLLVGAIGGPNAVSLITGGKG